MKTHKAVLILSAALLSVGCGTNITFDPALGTWPTPETPAWSNQARFAVSDNLSDQLSFVSADAQSPIGYGAITVGNVPVELEGPHHVAASRDGQFLYMNLSNYVPGTGSGPHGAHGTGSIPGSLLKLDARNGAKLGEVLVDRSPGDVVVSKDGKLAFVTHYDLLRLQEQLTRGGPPEAAYSKLAIVDTESMTRLAFIPLCVTSHGEGLSPDGKTLYVVCSQSDELVTVDVSIPSKPVVTSRTPVGPLPGTPGQPNYTPYAVSVSPTDGMVWISNNGSADVRVFDPLTMKMDPAKTIALGGVAMFGEFTKDGKTLYVPQQGTDWLSAIDVATLTKRDLVLPPESCLNAHAFAFAPDEQSAVIVCEGDHRARPGSVVFISVPPLTPTGYVTVGLFPDGAAWLPPTP